MTITAEDLGVSAGRDWLFRELDLHVDAGECLVLTGQNGTGKSTLLLLLLGVILLGTGATLWLAAPILLGASAATLAR